MSFCRYAAQSARFSLSRLILAPLPFFLQSVAYLIHDPLDRSLRDPYDNTDVSREHRSRHRLADGSCLELVGVKHMLDYKLAACLSKRLKKLPVFRTVQLRPIDSLKGLQEAVAQMRAANVQMFPILMEREMGTGLVVIIGCLPPKTYVGTLDDLLDVLSAEGLPSGDESVTRESLWDECR